MTSVDKAAIVQSIAIVAVAIAIAGAGGSGVSIDSGSPVMQEKTIMSQAEEREQAIVEQIGGEMVEEKVCFCSKS